MRIRLLIPTLVATAATGVLGQGIQLKLDRPESAGRISGYVVDQNYCSTTTLSPKGANSESNVTKNKIRFEARREVVAVGSDGAATKVQYTIANFQRRDNDGPVSEVFPNGRVVVAELKNGQTRFTVDGTAVDDASTLEALAMLNLAAKSGPGDDDVFHTETPREIGKAWDADMRQLAGCGPAGKQLGKESRGEAVIESTGKFNGTECVVFTMRMNLVTGAANLGTAGIDASKLPADFAVTKGITAISKSTVLPVNPSSSPMANKVRVEITTDVHLPDFDGREAELRSVVAMERTESSTFEPAVLFAQAVEPKAPERRGVETVPSYPVRRMPDPVGGSVPYVRPYVPAPPPPAPVRNADADGYMGSIGAE